MSFWQERDGGQSGPRAGIRSRARRRFSNGPSPVANFACSFSAKRAARVRAWAATFSTCVPGDEA